MFVKQNFRSPWYHAGISLWLQLLYDSHLLLNDRTHLQYGAALANRFKSVEDLLAADENELINIGFTNQLDRTFLIKQARIYDNKVSISK